MSFNFACSILISLACATGSFAQKVAEAKRTPYSQQFGLEEGLPSLEVYNLLPCKDGRLLVSTDNGPVYFDGHFFYPIPNRGPLPLSPIFTHMVADESDSSYTHVFLTENIRLTVSKKLIEYEKLERYPQFIRLHRSHIANLNRVAKYLKQDGGTLIMENNHYLSISQDKKNKVMAWWEQNKI